MRIAELRAVLLEAAHELDRLARLAHASAGGKAGASLDEATLELRVEGMAVQLTPGLAAIVGALLELPGRPVRRRTLARAIFGPNATARQELDINAQISRLRMGYPEVGRHIETVRGVGYRWKETVQCQ